MYSMCFVFSSPEMKGLSDDEKKALELKKEDDGEFWMDFKDFKQHYVTVKQPLLLFSYQCA